MEKFVKPAHKGLIVRFPDNFKTILPETGFLVPWIGKYGRYWRRRLNDGSIIECIKEKKIAISAERPSKHRRTD